MFRPAVRSSSAPLLSRTLPKPNTARRFISTAPPHKTSRSWKNSALRWGIAGALVYYYNRSSLFAAEPAHVVHSLPDTSRETETYSTVDALAEKRRAQAKVREESAVSGSAPAATTETAGAQPGSPESLQEEAGQQGAFNEETGEINWDCPCLGGMAHGPCGEQFREAFSCFVFSKDEPKGVDCIEHFKTMQNCFREHPEIYGSELDEEEVAEEIDAQSASAPRAPTTTETPVLSSDSAEKSGQSSDGAAANDSHDRSLDAQKQVERDHEAKGEADELVPKAAHDAR